MTFQLNKSTLADLPQRENLHLPPPGYSQLPERVLQFGTGVLLRGLPDYFIDRANRNGIFNGRIVVVKSTSTGGTEAFEQQDGLYTICERGVVADKTVENYWINSSISRVLTATEEWDAVLACAENPDLQIVISNTTEVGIVLVEENVSKNVPASFPGKLVAFLHKRYQHFKGAAEAGMVIIPTELLTNNGERLRDIVLELAAYNEMEPAFIAWLQAHNQFCNSLVDRIVPGKPAGKEWKQICENLGYEDELMIAAEPFNLWAIEARSPRVNTLLSFSTGNEGMVIAPDIEKFRELKLRLLNGTHTFTCGLAWLAGFNTVKEALQDENFSAFTRRMMLMEIADTFPQDLVSYNEACVFAGTVLDRFRNPFLEHRWLSITLNYTSKMRMRNIPLLLRYYKKQEQVPSCMSLGFAAYLLFMNCKAGDQGQYEGSREAVRYTVQDEQAPYFANIWQNNDTAAVVHEVLGNEAIWGTDLSKLPGWEQAVLDQLLTLKTEGALNVLRSGQLIQAEK